MTDPELTIQVRAAAAVRALGHELVARAPDEAVLTSITREVESLLAQVATAPCRERSVVADRRRLTEPVPADGARLAQSPTSTVTGPENPLGLAMTVRRAGHEAVGRVVLGPGTAGPPAIAHGGVVATLLDDIMGFVLDSLERTAGFTATLTVRYRRPVPVGAELEVRGRLRRREGRKLFIESSIAHDGSVLAEGEGLFIAVKGDPSAQDPSSTAASPDANASGASNMG